MKQSTDYFVLGAGSGTLFWPSITYRQSFGPATDSCRTPPWNPPSILQGHRVEGARSTTREHCEPYLFNQVMRSWLFAAATKEMYAFTVFERAFKDFGLPLAIRTDNGTPFASNSAFFGLSKPPVWWLRLGIAIERIKPGNPQQNGRHERMHLTLKKEATKPPAKKVRSLHRVLQPGASAPGAEYEISGRDLSHLATTGKRPILLVKAGESPDPIVLTRAGCSKRSSQICSASQFRRIIAAAGGCALTACTCAQSMTAR